MRGPSSFPERIDDGCCKLEYFTVIISGNVSSLLEDDG
jgi:hypothetical protein